MCAFDLMLLASWIFKKNGLRALFRRHLLRDSRDGDAELRQRAVPFGEREALPERVQAAPRHVVVLLQCTFPEKKGRFRFVENSTSQLKMNHLIHFSSFRINHTNHKTSLKTREQEADALLGMGESLVL